MSPAALCLVAALAAPQPKLAVLGVQRDKSVKDALPDVINEVVVTAAHEAGGYEVIGQDDIEAMLGFEKQKDALGCDDASCFVAIGGALGADKLLVVRVARLEGEWLVGLKLIDVRQARVDGRAARSLKGNAGALVQALPGWVRDVLSSKAPTPSPPAPPTPPAADAGGPSRCSITLPAEGCPLHAEYKGSFDDDWEGAGSNRERCLRRASDYATWCGILQGAVSASFLVGSSVAAKAESTRCQVALPAAGCKKHPEHKGTFNDAYEGSQYEEARCLRRAAEWQAWCDLAEPVRVTFFAGAKQQAERLSTSCEILLPKEGCPSHPEYKGSFRDDWEGAGSSRERCFRRAGDWVYFCGLVGPTVTARFRDEGQVLSSRMGTRCEVNLGGEGCPNHPEVKGVFNDWYEDSAFDRARCLARGPEFVTWCGKRQQVSVRFWEGGSVLASGTYP